MSENKVLVVDDQPEILEIIEEIITDCVDCQVFTANNGVTALEICEQNKFNLVFTDYIMPGMSGVELINKIRQSETENKNVPIVLLTGNEQEAQDHLSTVEGVQVLNKVDEINNILEIVNSHLENED